MNEKVFQIIPAPDREEKICNPNTFVFTTLSEAMSFLKLKTEGDI